MPNENLFYYKYIVQSILAWLEHNLYYTFDLSPEITVTNLIRWIVTAMKNSGPNFSFGSAPDHRFILNEILPLQLLDFNNQGI